MLSTSLCAVGMLPSSPWQSRFSTPTNLVCSYSTTASVRHICCTALGHILPVALSNQVLSTGQEDASDAVMDAEAKEVAPLSGTVCSTGTEMNTHSCSIVTLLRQGPLWSCLMAAMVCCSCSWTSVGLILAVKADSHRRAAGIVSYSQIDLGIRSQSDHRRDTLLRAIRLLEEFSEQEHDEVTLRCRTAGRYIWTLSVRSRLDFPCLWTVQAGTRRSCGK